jgi:hypothetical protein
MNLLLLVLLLVCIFCLGFGMAYQEKYRSGQALLATPEPGDDEIPIFDRVTFGLSRLPNIEGAKAVGSGTRSTVPRPDLPAR